MIKSRVVVFFVFYVVEILNNLAENCIFATGFDSTHYYTIEYHMISHLASNE